MTHEYTVVIECEDEPGFVATVPALPGCVNQGDTLDETLANVRDAISVWIQESIAHGESVPRDDEVVRKVKVAVESRP